MGNGRIISQHSLWVQSRSAQLSLRSPPVGAHLPVLPEEGIFYGGVCDEGHFVTLTLISMDGL